MTLLIEPIGVLHTNRHSVDDTPVQSALNREEAGEIHLETAYAAALEGLDGFSHLWILTWLGHEGQATGADVEMIQTPFLLRATGDKKGVLATRGPRRPNPIGLHLVSLSGSSSHPPVIYFRGVDMIDGTPVIDVKPWVTHFDLPTEAETRSGWFDRVEFDKVTPGEMTTPKEKK